MDNETAMLIEPEVSWREEFIAYCQEFEAANEPYVHGQLPEAEKDFAGLIRRWANGSQESNAGGITVPADQVPNRVYWLVAGQKLLGTIRLRPELNDNLLQIGGHIGYEVRPSQRGKGYASMMLHAMLAKARSCGLDTVLLTCAKDNPASARVICKHGGVLENEIVSRRNGRIVQRYWISLVPSDVGLAPEVVEFYDAGLERGRLFQGLGRIELARMQELLPRYLPAAPAVVADVGGGPGTYALWLASQGYTVHLVDAHPLHVEQAQEASAGQPDHPIASVTLGDARRLALADASAEAVLLHGPLYHLTEKHDRLRALAEARRVLRPNGLLLAVGITSYASTIIGATRGWVLDRMYLGMIQEEIETGQHRCPDNWKLFTRSFFHHPDRLASEIKEAGFHLEAVLGIEGPGWMVPDLDGAWGDQTQRKAILEVGRLMEHEPTHSPHVLAVARKEQIPRLSHYRLDPVTF